MPPSKDMVSDRPPGDAGAGSETSTLLSNSLINSAQENGTTYGTAQADSGDDCPAERAESTEKRYSNAFITRTVLALCIGAFTANADGSLMLATHPIIGSEFNNLESSNWLIIGFMLAGLSTQALYGKLSDIFGRKSLLLVSYALFAVGCAFVGAGQNMGQVIFGRVISGSGAAGLTVLVALIITDIVPLREVASWQSYLNIVATAGRSIGGPLGGVLTDTIGWRWSFLGQVPIFAGALVLCWMMLPPLAPTGTYEQDTSLAGKLGRIDFRGALLLGIGIFAFSIPFEIGGTKIPWNHPITIGLFVSGIVLIGLFVVVEEWWAKEPIFPVRLLRNPNVVLGYFISSCQMAAQLTMMFSVPLYFQVTQGASSTIAGAHLIPAVVGNATGALLSGYAIKRTGRYKALVIFSTISSITSYSLLILRFRGNTNWAESLYIFPGGMGLGITQTAIFVAIQASIDPIDRAAATSGLFLVNPMGVTIGMSVGSAVLVAWVRKGLSARLYQLGLDSSEVQKIVRKASENVHYISQATPTIAKAIVDSYTQAIQYSHYVSLTASVLGLVGALLLRERALQGR